MSNFIWLKFLLRQNLVDSPGFNPCDERIWLSYRIHFSSLVMTLFKIPLLMCWLSSVTQQLTRVCWFTLFDSWGTHCSSFFYFLYLLQMDQNSFITQNEAYNCEVVCNRSASKTASLRFNFWLHTCYEGGNF